MAYQTIEQDILDIIGEALAADLGLSTDMLDDTANTMTIKIVI